MAEDNTQLPPEHTPLPGQTFGGSPHKEGVKPRRQTHEEIAAFFRHPEGLEGIRRDEEAARAKGVADAYEESIGRKPRSAEVASSYEESVKLGRKPEPEVVGAETPKQEPKVVGAETPKQEATSATAGTSATGEAKAAESDGNLKDKAKAAMDGAKKTAEGLGQIFNQAKEGTLHANVGASAAQIKLERTALNAATDEAAKKVAQEGLDAMTKPKLEAFGKMKFTERTAASIGGNFGTDVGKGMKFARGTGAIVGIGAMISGGKDILAPAKDENGERKNGFAKTALKLAGGAAIIWASLVAGGKNRAMGI
ncbi:MAG: hypothetical protein AABY33_05750 [Pseudomonadota bacterium]